MTSAVVAGATGLVGSALVSQLLDDPRYAQVWVIARRTTHIEHAKLREAVIDFAELEALAPEVAAEDVFCCLGTTIRKAGSQDAFRRVDLDYVRALAGIMKQRGARRFMLVSAIAADPESSVFYNRIKGLAEQVVAKQKFEQSHVVRPSFLTGERREFRLGERLAIPLAHIVSPLLVGGAKKYRPVAAKRVARLLRECAARDRSGHHVHYCF